MGWTCCVPDCKSGLPKHATPSTTKFFRLPFHEPPLLQQWFRRIRRENFTPTKYSRICSRHFTDADFSTTSRDSNVTRKSEKALNIPYLLPAALPSIFTDRASYYQADYEPPPKRSSTTSAVHRLDIENAKISHAIQKMHEDDKVSNLRDLASKCAKCVNKPQGFFEMPSSPAAAELELIFRNVDGAIRHDLLCVFSRMSDQREASIFLHAVSLED